MNRSHSKRWRAVVSPVRGATAHDDRREPRPADGAGDSPQRAVSQSGWRAVAVFSLGSLIFAHWLAPGTNALGSGFNTAPGLRVGFTSLEGGDPGVKDVTVLPNLSLYVPRNTPPTPFVSAGPFAAVWTGFLSLDLRSEYRFQAELNGALKLELNGNPVLEVVGTGGATSPSQSIRLNKGTNRVTATFRSPATGDAFVRLSWIPKGGLPTPIPLNALAHAPDRELESADRLRLGRALFLENRCGKCHGSGPGAENNPEFALDAPSFEGIGARRNHRWMADWILDPKAQRSSAKMPRMLHGDSAKQDAEATAAFLASLRNGETTQEAVKASGEVEGGKQLFENLHCGACHDAPDGSEANPDRVSLKRVTQKFPAGTLAAFLRNPEIHYAWIRMPNFRLTDGEANQLASFLTAHAEEPNSPPEATDSRLAERGKKLVQISGCLNCHSLKLENQFSAKPLSDLRAREWNRGCLADTSAESSHSPFFALSTADREALRSFAASDRASLTRFVPTEFAHRQMANLKCQECHGKFEGFPSMEILGGKLNPEWATAFIAGEIPFKPRPWLPARMPNFPAVADGVGKALSMDYGYPPHDPAQPPVDLDAAKLGQKLVSADGGFSCISCHAVGRAGVTLVFDSPGINLAYVAERLHRSYFTRWLYSPLSVDPGTKMPVYFDELGKSSLSDILEGDGAKQIDAIWEYLRLGDKMPLPPGAEPAQP